MNIKTFFPFALATTISACHADWQDHQQGPVLANKQLSVMLLDADEDPRIELGAAFNSFNNEPTSSGPHPGCVIADELGTLGDVVNGPESYHMTRVTSQEALFLQLDTDSKGRLSSLVNIVEGNGDLELKTMSSIRINKRSSYLLLSARKVWQPLQIKRASVSPDAITLLKENPKDFFGKCGDAYLSALSLVTEAYGLIECRSDTPEAKQGLDRILDDAAGVQISSSSAAAFQATVDYVAAKADGKCQLYVWQRGGNGAVSSNVDSAGSSIVNYAIAADFSDAAVSAVGATSYQQGVISAEFWTLVNRVDMTYKDARAKISGWRLELEKAEGGLEDILDAADDEQNPGKKDAIYAEAQAIVGDVKTIERKILDCATKPDSIDGCSD